MTAPGPTADSLTVPKAIGWSIAFLASGMTASVLGYVALDALLRSPDGLLVVALVQAAAMLLAFGGLTWLVGVKILGLGPADLRWAPPGVGLPGFLRGIGIGAAPAVLALGLGVVAGGAGWWSDGGAIGDWLGAAGATGLALLPPALAEEVVFRGVPLVLLAAVLGRVRAAVLVSSLFALAHLLNPEITALALLNIALAGVFLSACFYLPGGLWTATGAHLGWNVALAALAAPVSGLPLDMPGLDYAPGGPPWLTGGAFGPEGGVLATATLAAASGVVIRRGPFGRVT